MKKTNCLRIALGASLLLVPAVSRSEPDVTNRLTLSARFGFNISAKFKGLSTLPPRITPDGDRYNYDDGYVLTDVSGNFGGQTWYWGYDDSASQVSGNTILMNRSTVLGNPASRSLDENPNYGAELTYSRQLGVKGKMHYGVEIAANYLNLALSDSSAFSGTVSRLTDAYPFTPGTTPPSAPPPYQGSFNGPGFVIGDTPVSSTTTVFPGSTIGDRREFDADVWGMRMGPYLEFPLGTNVSVSLSGGFAAALLNSEATWTQTFTLTGGGSASATGSGQDLGALLGFYAAANVTWRFHDRWNLAGGVQYQNLGDYQHSFGGRRIAVDLSSSLFVTLGVGYNF